MVLLCIPAVKSVVGLQQDLLLVGLGSGMMILVCVGGCHACWKRECWWSEEDGLVGGGWLLRELLVGGVVSGDVVVVGQGVVLQWNCGDGKKTKLDCTCSKPVLVDERDNNLELEGEGK